MTKEKLFVGNDVVVGRGYDTLNSPYVAGTHLKKRIVDLTAEEVEDSKIKSNKQRVITSSTSKEFISNFKNSYGGSIPIETMATFDFKRSFSITKEASRIYSYGQIHAEVFARKEMIECSQRELQAKLRPSFKADINDATVSPAKLFAEYGTHLLTSALIGGRVSINFTREKNVDETKVEFNQKMNVAMKEVLSVNQSTNLSVGTKKVIEESKITTDVLGGQYSGMINVEEIHNKYNSWLESINNGENTVLCGISAESDLIGIWQLAANESRRKEIETFYQKKASESINGLLKQDLFVTDIKVLSAGNRNTAVQSCPQNYILIDKDLNKGAGGNYIYLCYKVAGGDQVAYYTDLKIEDQGKAQSNTSVTLNGKTYQRFVSDLNKGAGGKYRYLLGMKGSENKIQRIDVVYGDDIKHTGDWEAVCWAHQTDQAADVNKGVGGKYVYVIVSKA